MVVVDTTKVRIFKQITTKLAIDRVFQKLLLIPQRYEFSSKSQHARGRRLFKICCCWYHKGTNFQANHNQHSRHSLAIKVVVDTTKVRIFKQITTDVDKKIRPELLLLIPQRYEFSSKSQRFLIGMCAIYRCCWYHKGTNFQANHNLLHFLIASFLLLLIPQRYEFSSKSQQIIDTIYSNGCCCWYHKGTNFQANHNSNIIRICPHLVVVDTTKVRIFKQITTGSH